MRTIYKYPIPIVVGDYKVRMPRGARILTIKFQVGHPQMWLTVDTDEPLEDRTFFLVETGEEIPKDIFTVSDYIGTLPFSGGSYVLHLFETRERK